VLVRGAGPEFVGHIAERIVSAVAVPVQLASGIASVGASVGIATGTSGTRPQQLVHCADVAMYAAKANGKGRVQVFVPGLLQERSAQVSSDHQRGQPPRIVA
jgi:GGDEF domain-containing protein